MKKIFQSGVIFLLLSCSCLISYAENEQEKILVEKIIGSEAWVKKGDKKEKEILQKGAVLVASDTVITGDSSHVVISLSDGSVVNIGPFTQYEILKIESGKDNFWQWSFRLLVGSIRALVRKALKDNDLSKFKIKTDAGSAGVRGTDFVVMYSKDNEKMDVYTLEGTAYLAPPDSEMSDPKTIFIPHNRMSSIGKDGIPQKQKAFLREEFLQKLEDRKFPKLELLPERKNNEKLKTTTENFSIVEPKGKDAHQLKGKSKEELNTLLLKYAANGDVGKLKGAMYLGADINTQDSNGATPMIIAAKNKNTTILKVLIDAKADANMADNEGNTALISAAQWGDLEGVVILRTTNADINVRDRSGKNAIDYARDRKNSPMMEFLKRWKNEEKNKH